MNVERDCVVSKPLLIECFSSMDLLWFWSKESEEINWKKSSKELLCICRRMASQAASGAYPAVDEFVAVVVVVVIIGPLVVGLNLACRKATSEQCFSLKKNDKNRFERDLSWALTWIWLINAHFCRRIRSQPFQRQTYSVRYLTWFEQVWWKTDRAVGNDLNERTSFFVRLGKSERVVLPSAIVPFADVIRLVHIRRFDLEFDRFFFRFLLHFLVRRSISFLLRRCRWCCRLFFDLSFENRRWNRIINNRRIIEQNNSLTKIVQTSSNIFVDRTTTIE